LAKSGSLVKQIFDLLKTIHMKIIVTGSLGNISKPLTRELVQKGHTVTVISSNPDKQKDIEAMNATAAIGSVDDADFITAAFAGADAVYCMTPDAHQEDELAFGRKIASNYAEAIENSGVKKVIHLSSYGAHLDKGTGPILGRHFAELILNELPEEIAITHMRPVYFYYNLNNYIGMIKHAGLIRANYGSEKFAMAAPSDIAAAIVDELQTISSGRKVRYVASDERTGEEVAGILGAAIGKPDLKWAVISDEQLLKGMEANGVPAHVATGLTEMFGAIESGALEEDYLLHKPAVTGKVKIEDYAKEFAALYNQ
jgi:uncharacterized protein YbjT (DUF2867 family)